MAIVSCFLGLLILLDSLSICVGIVDGIHRAFTLNFAIGSFTKLFSRTSDFARLARRLTGTSVGLVLGGGGAR